MVDTEELENDFNIEMLCDHIDDVNNQLNLDDLIIVSVNVRGLN